MAKKAKKKVSKLATMTFQLPVEMHKRLKARKNKTGEPVGRFINQALEKALKRAA
jgi:predicted DNA-binding protein